MSVAIQDMLNHTFFITAALMHRQVAARGRFSVLSSLVKNDCMPLPQCDRHLLGLRGFCFDYVPPAHGQEYYMCAGMLVHSYAKTWCLAFTRLPRLHMHCVRIHLCHASCHAHVYSKTPSNPFGVHNHLATSTRGQAFSVGGSTLSGAAYASNHKVELCNDARAGNVVIGPAAPLVLAIW
eukprot:scaffold221237_cov20-Tisochrysis_lutea.AAC.1